ncbi:Rhodanese- sulfurtransferase [Entomophthora muscae]|uniref:Rhodanese- sulfurtransferase n=1 Tax=Entomophthora muscae TaxID=34485 RepID=A0ACC2T8C5_9FUNG|nr:Rhodanese- sulfurtransferase [Entomophthora muscae]
MDAYIKEICRDGVQLLLNEVFQLPVVGTELGFMASLPKPTTVLPREKPVPKPKPLTRWEKFAKAKGIQNKKRDRMVFDEESGEYRPRYGYKGINQVDKDWLMEVPENVDPETDMFSKARADKKERVEKNEAQRVRNLKEASGAAAAEKKADSIMTPKEHAAKLREERSLRKVDLEKTAVLAQVSTASMGKFDKKIEGETKAKGIKRKFESTAAPDLSAEKESNLKILNKLTDGSAAKASQKEKIINVRKAIKASSETKQPILERSKGKGKGKKGGKPSKGK